MSDVTADKRFYNMTVNDANTYFNPDLERIIIEVIYDINNAYKNGYAPKNSIEPLSVTDFTDGFNAELSNNYNKAFVLHMLSIIYNNPDDENAYPFLADIETYKRRISFIKANFVAELSCGLMFKNAIPILALYDALMVCWEYEKNDANGIRIAMNHTNTDDTTEDYKNSQPKPDSIASGKK